MNDQDVEFMYRSQLKDEVRKLRTALRTIRDRTGHDLCWFNPEIWELLPEKIQPHPQVPDWCEFMHECANFRKSLEATLQNK